MLLPVPNQFPISTGLPYKLAVVGEAPNLDDSSWTKCLRCSYSFASTYKVPNKTPEILQECVICPSCRKPLEPETFERIPTPFVGITGQLLGDQLSKVGILTKACFIGNVCQTRPPGNEIKQFKWDGSELVAGRANLIRDLAVFKPNLILGLGTTALRFLRDAKGSIDDWRGSLFTTPVPELRGIKCCSTIHPLTVLREYSYMPMFKMDLARVAREARTSVLKLPVRNLRVDQGQEETLVLLSDIKTKKPEISVDIEGRIDTMYCFSIATAKDEAFIVPTTNQFWSFSNEIRFWKLFAEIMYDPEIPKIFQNGLYDLFVLRWSYGITVRGYRDDQMLKHWELYSELPKGLGFQVSIYTDEPFYKDDREHDDLRVRHEYCCKDSAVTLECRDVCETQFKQLGASREHYNFNLDLLEPVLFMELNGIAYDATLADKKLQHCIQTIFRLQWALNTIGLGNGTRSKADWLQLAWEFHGLSKSNKPSRPTDLLLICRKSFEGVERVVELLTKPEELSLADQGELSILTKTHLNVGSTKTLQHYLYEVLQLPRKYKKEHGHLTDKETSDQLALLQLWKATHDPVLRIILKMRSVLTRSKALAAETDFDGRIRCGYNVVGTETGRISCYESPTGSGFNLQTATKKDRDLFTADPGFWFFQCDLSGADGWTVAAHCAACGDSTMLEDYLFGLKPARIIALLYTHGAEVLSWSRERLKAAGKTVDGNGWLYFACKVVQHMSNYKGSPPTIVDSVLKASYKIMGDPILLELAVCKQLQQYYFQRYQGLLSWWAKSKIALETTGCLTSANGHKRIFFGRRRDFDTFKEFLAEEPQSNTSYVTNKVFLKSWTDAENRRDPASLKAGSGSFKIHRDNLRIQPLHQVHDAFCGQFRKEETEWACAKIRDWFNFTIRIAGIEVRIPFEGAYGKSWGDTNVGVL